MSVDVSSAGVVNVYVDVAHYVSLPACRTKAKRGRGVVRNIVSVCSRFNEMNGSGPPMEHTGTRPSARWIPNTCSYVPPTNINRREPHFM